jgi:hypothetical protein
MPRSLHTSPILRIEPVGKLGNQMFQFMVALKIMDWVPGLRLCGFDMPEWGLSRPVPAEYPQDAVLVEGQYVPVRQIARYLRHGVVHHLTMSALGMRLSNLKTVDYYREVFRDTKATDVESFGSARIVVNLRGAEILGNLHPDYTPIPLSFINQAVRSSGAQPVFLGQLGDDPYSRTIRERYPTAIFQPSRGPLNDFQTLRQSKQLVVAVSTFSWLAAWLSTAEKIHMPVAGFFHPRQRPEYDLLPSHDPRYVFYECEPRRWSASSADFDYLWAERQHRVLERSVVSSLRRDARARMLWRDFRLRLGIARLVRGHNVRRRLGR